MDWKVLASTFALLFVAELGDKTQLAVISMTAKTSKPFTVFLGATTALAVVTLIGALAGGLVTQWVPVSYLSKVSAASFIAIGVLMLVGKL